MRAMLETAFLPFVLACSTVPAARVGVVDAAQVTSPEAHLGRPVGADFQLVDWDEVSSYFRRLDAESDAVLVETVGQTTEGRDFLLATISAPANLARLDELRAHARTLADPRGRSSEALDAALRDGKVILFVSCSMHATECAGTSFALDFAYRLATSDEEPWRSAREECVVVLAPSLNPDGLDHVTSWYRETVGTAYEATGLTKLYQYYTGHDNNRDWFMLTQNETRLVTRELYSRWFPQVYWDVHQQGSTRERLFVPPFRDPLNPNLDAAVIGGIDVLGSRALLDLTRDGLTGVSTGVSYDMWWNGGNRNVPVRHNIVGLLTEAASANLASPIFLRPSELAPPRGLDGYAPSNRFPDPWPGGWWRLRDIVDYELGFARSLLGSLSRERAFWLRNAAEVSERVTFADGAEAPRAWVLPSDNRDPAAVRRLVDVLLASGVELHRAAAPLEADGRTWPAGSLVIRRDQPYGAHVKDLFEVQRYPEGDAPYDVAGWTLPFLLGVARVEVLALGDAELERVRDVDAATASFHGDPRAAARPELLSTHHSDAWSPVYAALARGERVALATDGADAGLLGPPEAFEAFEAEHATVIEGTRRLGLYSPWSGSMDEGWMRWVFDAQGVPYVTVRNEMLRAGALADFLDVLVIPSVSAGELDRGRAPGTVQPEFAGGLDAEGAVAIEEFVRGGGTLVTLGASSAWAVDLFELPLVDTARGKDAGEFACPGSVVRTVPEAHACTAGLPASVAAFFSDSSAWRAMTEAEREASGREGQPVPEVLLRYAPTRVLLSGWIRAPQAIEGHAAWAVARHGAGRVHLFGFRPQYRGWSQATFGLVHRAVLLRP
ncbi:MAG: peptidase M14 [Planctomycetes bacterium]|nr:peptidase M14 [Planctomycetota bacterium]